MSDFREYLDEQLRDPEFRAEYEAIRTMIDARLAAGLGKRLKIEFQ